MQIEVSIYLLILLSFAIIVESFQSDSKEIKIWNNETDLTRLSSLLVFISITSAPNHAALRQVARDTWLSPCLASNLTICDYRFFIDAYEKSLSNMIHEEQNKHGDLVFRDFCSLMSRHPLSINYGNSGFGNLTATSDKADLYPARVFYKIDWKVCYMRWIISNNRLAHLQGKLWSFN